MSLWRQLVRGVRRLTHRSTVEAELDDEPHDYYERACAELVARGLSREEAARAARRELGDLGRARETLRSYGWENGVDALAGDTSSRVSSRASVSRRLRPGSRRSIARS